MTLRTIEMTIDDIIAAWTAEMDKLQNQNPEGVWRGMAFSDAALKLLAQAQPVTPTQVAEAADLPLPDVQETFAKIKEQGGELDEDGHLIGLALTLNPTPHHFIVNGRTLYTWCALDAVFMPGLLGETAVVKSTCPTTNTPIQLTISPEGIEQVTPETAVLSIAIPGLSCRREDDAPDKPKTGPNSDGCNQMHFFASLEAAESWVGVHPGTAVFTPEEAYKLAYANWISRRQAPREQEKEIAPITSSPSCCC